MKRLEKMFKYINLHLFDGMLDMPELYMYNEDMMELFGGQPCDGICSRSDKDHYFIAICKGMSDNQTFDTLLHEMIHQHLVTTQKYWKHGKPFKKMCRKAIEEFYWRIL